MSSMRVVNPKYSHICHKVIAQNGKGEVQLMNTVRKKTQIHFLDAVNRFYNYM